MRVLIVEDNVNDRKILKLNIERHGGQAIEARDGQEALEILKHDLPDLIISDALMPHVDGFELLREVNKNPQLAAIPFVFYSAVYTGKQEEELALSLGADDFVVKPVEPELFWQRLQEILSNCRLQKKARIVAPTPQIDDFHRRYGRMVATKLEEKVKELEGEIDRRRQSEQEREKIIKELSMANKDLNNISQIIGDSVTTLNLDDMLRLFLERLVKALQADTATVYLKYGNRIRIRSSIGLEKSIATKFSVALNEGIPGIIATTAQALYIDNVRTDPRVVNPELQECGVVSLIGVPIIHNGEVLGAVQVGWKQAHPHNEREQLLLAVTAGRCANAITNCNLFDQSEENRKNLDLQIDRMPIANIVWDTNFMVQSWNPAATRIFGYTAQETVGKHPFDLIIPENLQDDAQRTWQALLAADSDENVPLIYENTTKDGRTIFCEWHNIPLHKEDGSVQGVLSMVLDITARLEAEQKLRQAKEEWERTFNAMSEAITIHDQDYRIIQYNQAAGQLLKTPEGETEDTPCHQRLWGQAEKCVGCPAILTFSDATLHHQEIVQEKLQKTFLVSTTPLLNGKGEAEKIIHVAKDITAQKKLEAQLRHAQKMEAIGTLAGGIAHDFNNILTAIMGYAELVQLEIGPENKAEEDIQQVITAGNRAADLVKQILTISRQSEPKRQPVEIQHILKEALKLLRPSISSSIEIKSTISPQCPATMADPTEIHQVIMNLCTNAYHAMRDTDRDEPMLGIRLEPVDLDDKAMLNLALNISPGRFIKLTVSDTGAGMDTKTMARIFDPYFTTKEKERGTGLGLATVHSIVSGSGGAISVASKKGEGTTFYVYFPVHEGDTSQKEAQEDTVLTTQGTERIMVIDDEEPIVQLMHRALSTFGYQVTALRSGEDALRIFREQPTSFDLVITDMNMPKMLGTDLARAFLETRPDLPIILCTGFSEQVDDEKAKNIGIKELVHKPLEINILAKLVRKILNENEVSKD